MMLQIDPRALVIALKYENLAIWSGEILYYTGSKRIICFPMTKALKYI